MWRIGLIILIFISQGAQADINNAAAASGQMQFQGEVIADTCIIDDGNQYLTVDMGQASNSKFRQAGDDSDPVMFSLNFRHCSPNVSRNMVVAFRGVADKQNPDLLAVETDDNDARGIGIALFDDKGNLIPVNTGTLVVKPEYAGPLTVNLTARYRSTTDNVSGGLDNAQAWFSFTYQ